jgi:hypothetical protein
MLNGELFERVWGRVAFGEDLGGDGVECGEREGDVEGEAGRLRGFICGEAESVRGYRALAGRCGGEAARYLARCAAGSSGRADALGARYYILTGERCAVDAGRTAARGAARADMLRMLCVKEMEARDMYREAAKDARGGLAEVYARYGAASGERVERLTGMLERELSATAATAGRARRARNGR